MSDGEKSKSFLPEFALGAYDVFSIIVPGGCLLICAYYFEELFATARPTHSFHDLAVHWMSDVAHKNPENPIFHVGLYAVSILLLYLSGHVIATASNFFLDRVFVCKGYGYPYEILVLDDPEEGVQIKRLSRLFYRGSIFWFNIGILYLVIYSVLFSAGNDISCLEIFVATCFVVAVLKIIITDKLKKWFDGGGKSNWFTNSLEIVLRKCAAPYTGLSNLVFRYLNTDKPLESSVRNLYLAHFKRQYGHEAKDMGSNNYWFTLFYLRQRDMALYEIVQRWHLTSTFARNMSTAFYLAYIYAAMLVVFKHFYMVPPENCRTRCFVGQ